MEKRIKILTFFIIIFFLCNHGICEVFCGRIFKDTFYPLDVYYVKGDEKGPTVMVQGGIQGDETSGILTAQLLAKCKLEKGNLIVVPRANVYSILMRKREINVDMNRRFDKDYGRYYEDFLVRAVKYLASLSDGLIHLHEGSGFYSPKYISPLRNPFRYGQSIIIDTTSFNGTVHLASLALKVLNKINAEITPAHFSFNLFNMNTISSTTRYPEQRKSFTYYVVKKLKKPAFAVEVSKNISDLEWKIVHQLKTVIELLSQLGVVVVPPRDVFSLVKDELTKLPNIHLNGKSILKKEGINLSSFSLLGLSIDNEFPLGWSVVIENNPYLNLLIHKVVLMDEFREICIKHDGIRRKCIRVRWLDNAQEKTNNNASPVLLYSLNNKIMASFLGSDIIAKEGQTLILLGILNSDKDQILNAKGIVTNPIKNDGQDRARPILLNESRFIKRYLNFFKGGWSFYIENTKDIKWKVKVLKPSYKGILLLGNSVVSVPRSQQEIKLRSGKYRIISLHNRDLVCFINKNPIPVYKDKILNFKKGQTYKLDFFDAYSFEPVQKLHVKVF